MKKLEDVVRKLKPTAIIGKLSSIHMIIRSSLKSWNRNELNHGIYCILLAFCLRCGSCCWSFLWADHHGHGIFQRTPNHLRSQQPYKQSRMHCWAVLHTNRGIQKTQTCCFITILGYGHILSFISLEKWMNTFKHYCTTCAAGQGHLCQWQSIWLCDAAWWEDILPRSGEQRLYLPWCGPRCHCLHHPMYYWRDIPYCSRGNALALTPWMDEHYMSCVIDH